MELLKLTAKIDVVHVAYKGAPQALSDVIGGQIPASAQTAPAVLPAIQGGRVRPLAVTSLKRIAQLPSVPTMDESALPGRGEFLVRLVHRPMPVPILDKVHADSPPLRTAHRGCACRRSERFREMMIDVAPTSRSNSRSSSAEAALSG
jgi:hypothetical protein